MQNTFFELLQVALDVRLRLSHTPNKEEWCELHSLAKKHGLEGVCFSGVQKLQVQGQETPEITYLKWLGITAKIQQKNEVLDRLCVDLQMQLANYGLESCVLKGQGIAQMYNENLRGLRQSGDIDVWVKGGFDVVNEFVQRTAPTKDFAYHRFHYDAFPGTEVELHFRPTLMRNLFVDRKLQEWCDSFKPESFVKLDLGFYVPSIEFNRIYILTHIYRHFLFEGVGLRQVMDYYFVLRTARDGGQVATKVSDIPMADLLKELHLTRFAKALMWVMGHVFAMDIKYMICEPDEKEGRFLLDEIMHTGNFGYGETRYNGFSTFRRMTIRGSHLLIHYPSEVIWTPIWLVYHKIWKLKYKRKTR